MLSKYFKFFFLPLAVNLLFVLPVFAQDEDDHHGDRSPHEIQLNTRDLAALRDFLNSKRQQDILEKFSYLSFSGDVRFEWRYMTETMRGVALRPNHNDFDIEANFWVTYEKDQSWAVMQLQYDNSAGVDVFECELTPCEIAKLGRKAGSDATRRFRGSGNCDNICLKRAFMGYQFYEGCNWDADFELGRRPLYDVFESDIEFNARMDGIVFEVGRKLDWAKRFYGKVAGFVVNERLNHFAWATEVGLLGVRRLDIKYSFIDWTNQSHGHHAFDYRISQLLGTYTLDPKWFYCIPSQVYAAALVNHYAKEASLVDKDTGAWGFYTGIIMGEVEKAEDWALEIEYQWVGENAIPYDDSNGIGVGDKIADFCEGPGPSTGFQGFYIDFLYALTDHLTIDTTIEVSRALGRFPRFGEGSHDDGHRPSRRHHFSKFEIEAAYGF